MDLSMDLSMIDIDRFDVDMKRSATASSSSTGINFAASLSLVAT